MLPAMDHGEISALNRAPGAKAGTLAPVLMDPDPGSRCSLTTYSVQLRKWTDILPRDACFTHGNKIVLYYTRFSTSFLRFPYRQASFTLLCKLSGQYATSRQVDSPMASGRTCNNRRTSCGSGGS